MAKAEGISTTPGQRKKLYQYGNGVGFIAYKCGENTTCEVEFYVDRRGQLCYVKSGTPLRMEIAGEDGQMREVQIVSRFWEADVEQLAALEHKQWAHWTRHMLANLTDENIARWRRQIDTPYEDLSEQEKESDREWARKVWEVI